MNKKTVFGVVIGAAMTLGSVGAGELVTAYAAGETVYANGKVYTETQRIQYEQGREYQLDVKLSTDTGISGFQMEFSMPAFTEIVEVRENEGTFHYTQYMYEGNNAFSINGMSDEDKTEELLFTVVYTIKGIDGSFAIEPSGTIQQCTNTNFDYVEGIVVECGEIIVETRQETRLKGDMDENGVVNLEDLLIIQRSLIDPTAPLNGWQTEYADINRDGRVDLLDCQYVQMYIVQKLDSLENVGNGNESNPVESIVYYTLAVNNKEIECTRAIKEGDTAVIFMEMYKIYENVAYSEIFVYAYSEESDETIELTSETVLTAGGRYRVVLLGGTQLGGGDTETKINVFAQIRRDGVIYGAESKQFYVGDTLSALRDACAVDGYIVEGLFMDEKYSEPVSESEIATTLLEANKTYYVSLIYVDEKEEGLEVFVTVVREDSIINTETVSVSDKDTAATLQERYKEYNGETYEEVRVYEYASDGAMVELTSETALTAGGRYRVVLSQRIVSDVVGGNEGLVGAYTYAKDVEEVLLLNEEGSFEMAYQGKIIKGSQYTITTVDNSSMRAEVVLLANEGVNYRVTLNLVDKTFTI